MDNSASDLQGKVKKLEAARDQLGKGWLQTEREKSRLSAAIDNLQLGILFVDDYNNIIKKNPALDVILGKSTQGDWTIETIQFELKGAYDLAAACRACFAERKAFGPIDLPFQDKLIRLYFSPIVLLKGSVTVFGSCVLIEDISREKELAEARDEFLAIASHEIRYPLSIISQYTSKILSVIPSKSENLEIIKMLSTISENTNKLVQIVYDFLDLARIQTGKIPFKKETFAISDVIFDVVNELKASAGDKKINLDFDDIEKGLLKVIADKERVKQVLFNLVVNAIHYTQKGRVRIFLEQKDDYMKIFVEDTGGGISDETKNILFKKFIKPANGVSGIGLYISRLLVMDMGGQIYLERTEVGQGTTFAFTLPLSGSENTRIA